LRALQPTPRIGLGLANVEQHAVPGMTGADDSGQIRSAVTQVTRRGADLRAIDDQLTQCWAISRVGKRAQLRASDARSFGRPRRLALASLLPASLTFDAAFGTVSR
jgi:hypothetical protein